MYRNDHEAALARVDALEKENTKLAAENARLRRNRLAPTPKRERVPVLGTIVSLTAFGALAFAPVVFLVTR